MIGTLPVDRRATNLIGQPTPPGHLSMIPRHLRPKLEDAFRHAYVLGAGGEEHAAAAVVGTMAGAGEAAGLRRDALGGAVRCDAALPPGSGDTGERPSVAP
ncbi:hypothetical protein GCM10011490_11920 [Pseudoclavibacter endophyticus]|nr:hypothetical protein GCM10011490_11920 [Pseudoclavibacter endophyticus]